MALSNVDIEKLWQQIQNSITLPSHKISNTSDLEDFKEQFYDFYHAILNKVYISQEFKHTIYIELEINNGNQKGCVYIILRNEIGRAHV